MPDEIKSKGGWFPEVKPLHGRVHITAWQKTPCGGEELIKDDTFDNLIVDVGKDSILKNLAGCGITCGGTTHIIGVGDSSTAAAAGNTDLIACPNRLWKLIATCDKIYIRPTLFVSVDFGYGCANYTWNEIALADCQGCPSEDPNCGALLIARQIDCTPLVKTSCKRAIVEWQLTL